MSGKLLGANKGLFLKIRPHRAINHVLLLEAYFMLQQYHKVIFLLLVSVSYYCLISRTFLVFGLYYSALDFSIGHTFNGNIIEFTVRLKISFFSVEYVICLFCDRLV